MTAIYEITLRGQYYNQEIINRFHYVNTAIVIENPSALDLLTNLGFILTGDPPEVPEFTLFEAILNLANTNYLALEVECRNLYSTTDFYVAAYATPIAGRITGVPAAPFLSYGFYSTRVRTDIRRGTKRFAGVTEEGMGNGGVIVSGYVATMAALAEKMSAVIDSDRPALYSPAVLSFQKYTTDAGNSAYRPYPTEAEQLARAAYPVSWGGYTDVRSQVSRQFGRGR